MISPGLRYIITYYTVPKYSISLNRLKQISQRTNIGMFVKHSIYQNLTEFSGLEPIFRIILGLVIWWTRSCGSRRSARRVIQHAEITWTASAAHASTFDPLDVVWVSTRSKQQGEDREAYSFDASIINTPCVNEKVLHF